MNKYKVGDRVRVIKRIAGTSTRNPHGMLIGEIAVIVECLDDCEEEFDYEVYIEKEKKEIGERCNIWAVSAYEIEPLSKPVVFEENYCPIYW